MYRLLIVDDEHHVADQIETIFLTQTRMDLEVHKAYLASDALEILNRLKIDVLLTDIKMPGADGFYLADRVTEQWPEARIIFLTAYSEFDLIYKTQKYKSVSFLLKTEGEEAIIDVVFNAISEIERSRRLILARAESDSTFKQTEGNKALALYLNTGDPSGISAHPYIDTRKETSAVLIVTQNPAESVQKEDMAHLNALALRVKAMLGDKVCLDAVYTDPMFAVLVFQPQGSMVEPSFSNSLQQSFDTITETVLDIYGAEAVTAITQQPFMFNELFEKIDHMKQFLASSFESGSGRVFTNTDEANIKKEKDLIDWKTRYTPKVNAILGAIRDGDYDKVLELMSPLEKAAESVSNKLNYPIIIVYEQVALCLLDRIISKKLFERISIEGDIYHMLLIDSFSTWKDAFDFLERIIRLLKASDTEVRDISENRFLKYIYDYVDAHISEDLSLSVLSAKMNYNPSYISRLFKRLTGQTLLDYITSRRMDHAVKMLTETNASIQEIAKATGISSGQYFALLFRKKYGVSPLDYRRDHSHK